MDFFRKLARSKSLSLLLLLGAFALLHPQPAHAGPASWFIDLGSSIIGKIFFYISYLIAIVAGIIIMAETWIIGIILDISRDIANSPPVRYGFPVALSFANLSFLVGMIVIAIMTILRQDSYGVKNVLWKLIAMALLVNFGLVIATGILQFSDSVATYFLAAVDPGTNGQFSNFASAFAGAFNPQKGFGIGTDSVGAANADSLGQDSSLANWISPITGLFFTIFALIAIIVTLGALVVMLLVRYIQLTYLLILLPLAWAAWVFPGTKGQWNKWWDKFIKQTFFLPIALFFLWLTVQISYEMSKAGGYYAFPTSVADGNNPLAAIGAGMGNLVKGGVVSAMQITVMVSLALGGLIAANGLSIQFADKAQGVAKGAFKGVGNYMKNRGYRGAGRVLNRGGDNSLMNRAQNRVAGINNRYLRAAAGLPMQGLAKLTTKGSEDQVKQYEAQIGKMSLRERKAALLSTISAPKRIALIKSLMKDGELGDVNLGQDTHSQSAKAIWQRYGQIADHSKVEKAVGMNVEMYESLKAGRDKAEIDALARKFAEGLTKKDVQNMAVNDIFSGKPKFGLQADELSAVSKSFANGVASEAPEIVPGMLAKMKPVVMKQFRATYEGELESELQRLAKEPDSPDKEKRWNKLVEANDNFKKALGNNALGMAAEDSGGGGAAPAPKDDKKA